MTPRWLYDNANFTGPYALNSTYLEILPTTIHYLRALQVQLVAPDVLTTIDSVSVTITIAMDTALPNTRDHDPTFGISDGNSFLGFIASDIGNYRDISPCIAMEGNSVNSTLQNRTISNAPLVRSRKYSSEIKLQFRPTEQWGSCHTEHNEGYTNIANYQHTLDLTNGLYLEMYHPDKTDRYDRAEMYRIRYMAVDVHAD